MHDADLVLRILRSHSSGDVAYLAGYLLVAWALNPDGTLSAHYVLPNDQCQHRTALMLDACKEELVTRAQ